MSLKKTREIKSIQKIHNYILEIEDKVLKEEHCVLSEYEKLHILNLIFQQPFTYYKIRFK